MLLGTGIGRLPYRIPSNFGGYTASHWKNWTLIYSMFCFKRLLEEDQRRCWQTFVLACQYLTSLVLSKTNNLKTDLLFIEFGERFKKLFGR